MWLISNFVIWMLSLGIVSYQAIAKDDPVVAIVNGKNITQSEVRQAKKLLPERYSNEPIEMMFPGLIRSLIDSYLTAIL